MTKILLAAVFLMVLLAEMALTPETSGATGTHAILTVSTTVTGGYGYSTSSGSGDSLSPSSWTLKTDTGTVSARVTAFYWSASYVFFHINQCLFEDGKDLTGLMIAAIPIPVVPANRVDCYSYQVRYDDSHLNTVDQIYTSYVKTGHKYNVEIFWPNALYDTRLDQPVKLAAPTNASLSAPVLKGDTYEVAFQWDYDAPTNDKFYWYEVEWNGQIYVADPDLVETAAFSDPGPVTARVRGAGACKRSVFTGSVSS